MDAWKAGHPATSWSSTRSNWTRLGSTPSLRTRRRRFRSIRASRSRRSRTPWRSGAVRRSPTSPTNCHCSRRRLVSTSYGSTCRRIEIGGLLASGEHSTALGQLEPLLARHPLRESLWGLAMLASYRAGRQADALNAYGRARELLADELGIDPSPELARLHERILKQDPALDLRGEPLRGYRLLEKIGSGPHGVVFRGVQPRVGRDVAVKVFNEQIAADPDSSSDSTVTRRSSRPWSIRTSPRSTTTGRNPVARISCRGTCVVGVSERSATAAARSNANEPCGSLPGRFGARVRTPARGRSRKHRIGKRPARR